MTDLRDRTWHHCHFCGEYVSDGKDPHGRRHWLSDCRPDLVEHEPGPLCTWYRDDVNPRPSQVDCYAFQDGPAGPWTNQHTHFYPDGPM